VANRFSEAETAHAIPETVFPLWFSDAYSFEVIKSHTRLVYRVTVEDKRYYLKINPESDQVGATPLDRSRYDRSTDFALHLANRGAPVARPISSTKGNPVEIQTFEGVDMMVQASEEALGETVSEDCRDTAVFLRCGAALAKFHSAASTYPAVATFGKDEWEKE